VGGSGRLALADFLAGQHENESENLAARMGTGLCHHGDDDFDEDS
jgi:hypothetical protein